MGPRQADRHTTLCATKPCQGMLPCAPCVVTPCIVTPPARLRVAVLVNEACTRSVNASTAGFTCYAALTEPAM